MSHVCAKPACTEPVQVWLDFAPTSQQVFERADRTEVSVGLCHAHASRFTVPDGWTFVRVPDETQALQPTDAPSTPSQAVDAPVAPAAKNRTSTRDRPWFLALRDDEAEDVDQSYVASQPRSDAGPSIADGNEPSVGSLLHRAFHGPDRDVDTERAARDQHDELESRRAARDIDAYSPAELPFPPFKPEHRAAVS